MKIVYIEVIYMNLIYLIKNKNCYTISKDIGVIVDMLVLCFTCLEINVGL